MVKAVDLGEYFRIPADVRDLNYNLFFSADFSASDTTLTYPQTFEEAPV